MDRECADWLAPNAEDVVEPEQWASVTSDSVKRWCAAGGGGADAKFSWLPHLPDPSNPHVKVGGFAYLCPGNPESQRE